MRRRHLAVAIALLAGCARNAPQQSSSSDATTAKIRDGFAQLHAGADRFRTFDSAVAAGYPAQSANCYYEPGTGAMGYHHVNRALVGRDLDPAKPQILLYERTADRRYNLTAVEFIVPYRLWPKDSTPPQVMGLPLGHVDVLNTWGLHMWLWKENRNGMFAWWNPDVQCLADSTRMPEHAM